MIHFLYSSAQLLFLTIYHSAAEGKLFIIALSCVTKKSMGSLLSLVLLKVSPLCFLKSVVKHSVQIKVKVQTKKRLNTADTTMQKLFTKVSSDLIRSHMN